MLGRVRASQRAFISHGRLRTHGHMALSFRSAVSLNDGRRMPVLGLGTYGLTGRKGVQAMQDALAVGYRLLDTARLYANEREVGLAIRGSGVPREEVFVTTKLWNRDHGYESTIRACERSLRELEMDSVDLYLIHWPVPGRRRETWKAMEVLCRAGKARSIGVSNYTIGHLEELAEYASIVPAVNQVEFHPFLYQKDLLDYCRTHRIQVEGYSPLTQGRRLDDPRLRTLAAKYRRTPAQVLIRWALQHDLVVIPKSGRPERIRENSQVFDFEIAAEDMAALDSLDQRLHTSWDPTREA